MNDVQVEIVTSLSFQDIIEQTHIDPEMGMDMVKMINAEVQDWDFMFDVFEWAAIAIISAAETFTDIDAEFQSLCAKLGLNVTNHENSN